MENEDKDKKVILTDEELKDVTGGELLRPLYSACSRLPQYECVKKEVCAWDTAKKVCFAQAKK
jgi:hypothetical protein